MGYEQDDPQISQITQMRNEEQQAKLMADLF
jgi:hypothetical protein